MIVTEQDRKTLAKVSDEADAVSALVDAGRSEDEAKAAVRAWQAERAGKTGHTVFLPQPMAFDFDAVPDPPDWIVHGVIERGTVAMFSGDTGAAKSIVSQWLTVSALTGADFFGRATAIDRIAYIDEENPDGLVTARLRAMGLTNDDADRLRYFSREGFTLGTEDHDGTLGSLLGEFKPDLVVIDTLMSASSVDVNDNVAAVQMMKRLRALAKEHGCSFLVLHHERKKSTDGPAAGSSQQAMGARQWAGQADAMMTIATETDMQRDDIDDGHFTLRRTFKLRLAEKDRDGRLNSHRRIAVDSEKDERERLLWMTVSDEGPITEDTAQDATEAQILAVMRTAGDDPIGRKDIAAATGEKNPSEPSGTFKRGLRDLIERADVEKVGQRFRLTDQGREAAGLAV